jgi:hypothetical protein
MVDTPFVSEDFQRAFRNQFPSQVSSGRDLHVSDVVIPVVDFTPTASGASLPLDLRFARSSTTSTVITSTNTSNGALTSTSGFYRVISQLTSRETDAAAYIKVYDGSTYVIVSQLLISATSGNTNTHMHDDFIVYVKAGSSLVYDFNATLSSSTTFFPVYYQVADVNGNLTQPNGYDPQ